jgi:hypothetical protein
VLVLCAVAGGVQRSAPDLLPAALQLKGLHMVQFQYEYTYRDASKVLVTQKTLAVGIGTDGSFDRPAPGSLKPLSAQQKQVEQAFLHFLALVPGRQNYVVTELAYCAVLPNDVFFFDAHMYAHDKLFCSFELKGYAQGVELLRQTHQCNDFCKRLKLPGL